MYHIPRVTEPFLNFPAGSNIKDYSQYTTKTVRSYCQRPQDPPLRVSTIRIHDRTDRELVTARGALPRVGFSFYIPQMEMPDDFYDNHLSTEKHHREKGTWQEPSSLIKIGDFRRLGEPGEYRVYIGTGSALTNQNGHPITFTCRAHGSAYIMKQLGQTCDTRFPFGELQLRISIDETRYPVEDWPVILEDVLHLIQAWRTPLQNSEPPPFKAGE